MTDPPMKPSRDTTRWFESGPDPILNDFEAAVMIIRIGMASNALSAQFYAGRAALHHKGTAGRTRNIIASLVTAAAVTFESIRLAQEYMPAIRRLASSAGAPPELLKRAGKLCAGKHPASPVLDRARNELGFHWDKKVIARSVQEYGRNQALVWVEVATDDHPVHRLATDVLTHALFPEASTATERATAHQAYFTSMHQIDEAMQLIIELFTAALYGYLREHGATRRVRRQKRKRSTR